MYENVKIEEGVRVRCFNLGFNKVLSILAFSKGKKENQKGRCLPIKAYSQL